MGKRYIHVDTIYPRIKFIEATQLAWSTITKKEITAEVIAMPVFKTEIEFKNLLIKAEELYL